MTESPLQQVRHLLIAGRVQGVGFRWFTRERARRRGLCGWVQNCTDGSVEVMVAGSEDVLADFLADLARGPEGSDVRNVQELSAARSFETDAALPFPFQILKQPPP